MSEHQSSDIVEDGHIIVRVIGKLDVIAAKEFEARLSAHIESPQPLIVLDFSECDYISSAGLRGILIAAKKSQTAKTTLVLAGMNKMVRQVFRVSGFDRMLDIEPDVATALANQA
ncbi:MAG: STAS domain-containing protein [Pseudomonadota bacterium]